MRASRRQAVVVLVLAVLTAHCSHADAPAAAPPIAAAVERSPDWRYFQHRLILEGADLHGTFGSNLTALGLGGRELQHLPIADAYAIAHDRARRISDTATRRAFLLELFDETEP